MQVYCGSTRISLSFWFALMLCVVLLCDKTGAASVALISATAHECGHIAVFVLQGRAPAEIAFTPFGLRLTPGIATHAPVSYKKEIQAALAGPLVNLLFCVLTLYCRPMFYINAALFIFNMLPCGSLDGGRALYAFIVLRKGPSISSKIITLTSTLCVILTFGIFFVCAIHGIYNFSLFLATFYLGMLTLYATELHSGEMFHR